MTENYIVSLVAWIILYASFWLTKHKPVSTAFRRRECHTGFLAKWLEKTIFPFRWYGSRPTYEFCQDSILLNFLLMCCKLLDTTDYDRPVGGIEWREGISSGSISYGLEIVDIEGLEQQGLQICYLAPQEIAGQKNFKTRTIYWDCGVWRVCQ